MASCSPSGCTGSVAHSLLIDLLLHRLLGLGENVANSIHTVWYNLKVGFRRSFRLVSLSLVPWLLSLVFSHQIISGPRDLHHTGCLGHLGLWSCEQSTRPAASHKTRDRDRRADASLRYELEPQNRRALSNFTRASTVQ